MNLVRLGLALLLAASCVMGQDRRLGPRDGFDLQPADMERVRVGMPAPDFTLESKDGDLVTLSNFRGQNNIVLVFYRGYW